MGRARVGREGDGPAAPRRGVGGRWAWLLGALGLVVSSAGWGAARGATGDGGSGGSPGAVAPVRDVVARGETDPVDTSGDSADDPAIWIDRRDPSRSLVIGTNKLGGLQTYDLSGKEVQRIGAGSRPNNVDLRYGFRLAGRLVDVVGVAGFGMRFYTVDPTSRTLTDVTAPDVRPGIPVAGTCMYKSPLSGRFYIVANTRDGRAQQWELVDQGGRIGIRSVRGPWRVGRHEAEGCVFDDERQALYHAEEGEGIWWYGAEPDAPTARRTLVDGVGRGGLVADVEGLVVVPTAGGPGYLVASSQGDDSFAVYRRDAPWELVHRFRVVRGAAADGCERTDGIDATATGLGSRFPLGLFVCQDHRNPAPGTVGHQNFKLVPLESILDLAVGSSPRAASGP